MDRSTRATRDSGVVPDKWSESSNWVVLVLPLQSVAPDLEVEESDAALAQEELTSWPRGGTQSRRNAADRIDIVRSCQIAVGLPQADGGSIAEGRRH